MSDREITLFTGILGAAQYLKLLSSEFGQDITIEQAESLVINASDESLKFWGLKRHKKKMEEIAKKLYKTDTKGRLRVLIITTHCGMLSQTSGLSGGSLITHSKKALPKNVGKANATSSSEQAILEAKALIVKKLKEGYSESEEKALENEVILPMLAKVFANERHKIDWRTAYVQPKLDGMRCLDTPNGKISRKNTPITTMDHIEVKRPGTSTYVVDGELYAHGLTFQENMKIIKKKREGTESVKFHVYDIISKLPFIDRYALLIAVEQLSSNVEIVPTHKVTSMEEVQKYHSEFIAQGYEGTMIRWGDAGYKVNGRSENLLKYKDFMDMAYKIVDVVPSDANPEQGVIECEGYKGEENGERFTFRCGMKFSHAEREEILQNKDNYIGQTAEIRFFEFTDDGIPRFPVCVGFRLDK